MFAFFKMLLDIIEQYGDVTKCAESETYSSIDVTIDGEKYMLTIMKEAKKDDSVRTDDGL